MSIKAYANLFADEAKAIEFVESLIWPNGATCPYCNQTDRIKKLPPQRTKPSKVHPEGKPVHGLWKCYRCRKQTRVTVGTIFEDSHIELRHWLFAIHAMCSSKKGVSANQLHRTLDISYKAAWFLCHRVREAMTKEPLLSKLGEGGGLVELDETFIGGKPANNKHRNRTDRAGKKIAVMTLINREGDARTFPIPDTRKRTLQSIAVPNVDGSAHIITDSHLGYDGIDKHFASHHTVDHSKQYVRAIIFHTNFAESYHSLLKRGIVGSFHHISEKHLPRYLREFEFRWNSRKVSDGDRTAQAIKGAAGKRLTYSSPRAN